MHRRSLMKAAATGAAATDLATILPSSGIGQTTNEWRLLALWPEGHPLLKHLGRFAAMVRVVTQGGLKITIVPRGPVPPPKLLAAVGNGEAEMGHAVPVLWGKTIPSAAVLVYFPFGLTSHEKEAWLAMVVAKNYSTVSMATPAANSCRSVAPVRRWEAG